MGNAGTHRRLRLRDPRDGRAHDAVWFGAGRDVPLNASLCVAFELMVNHWQGRESLQLLVRHCEAAAG
jgi:single-stranded-DNA-specific exonuclease